MKVWKIITILIVVILILAGTYFVIQESLDDEARNGDDGSVSSPSDFTVSSYPRVDGSTSAHPLEVMIACHLLDVDHKWEWTWDETRRLQPYTDDEGREYIAEYIINNTDHHGTHGAYVNLIEKACDFILVARAPSGDELELAVDLGIELEVKAIALDAFVFIVNVDNPVADLTIEEVQKIYTGELKNWNEVDGPHYEINAYQRDDNSGSQELMETLVMKDLEMIDAPNMILFGMMGPINMLSTDENGIGYSVYFFEQFMAPNDQIKLCAINGVVPNYENIQTKLYPYTTEVYAAIRADQPSNSTAYQLRDWLLTKDGQNIVKESGYVPIL